MKAVLEFNLPEEQQDFYLASNAFKLAATLRELIEDARRKDKYGTGEEVLNWSQVREWLHGVIKDTECPDDLLY